MSVGTQRRYLKLRARAIDQRGTPEGDLCQRMADSMLAVSPGLADGEASSLPTEYHEYRWKTPTDRDVLQWVIEAQGADPKAYTKGNRGGGRSRVLLADVDDPTHAAIVYAYGVLRERTEKALNYALVGFLHGAMPKPNDDDDDDSDDDEVDRQMLDMMRSGYEAGRRNRPQKALGEPTP